MEKKCNKCKDTKSESEFSWQNKTKGTLNSWCKSCIIAARMVIYYNNWEKERAYRDNYKNARRESNRKWILEYLSCHPCVDCGDTRISVLEFDHVRGEKKFSISEKISHSSLSRIQEEVQKCDVRCANCHRIRTSQTNNWWR